MMRAFNLIPLLLAGCAAGVGDSSPSLLPRATERQSFDEPERAPPAAAQPDPALDAQLATLTAAALEARTDFAAADRQAAAALAAGARARVGSDAWLDAQTALAALDEQRASLLAALTGMEELAIARAAAGQVPYPVLEAARAETDAALAEITATVAARKAQLPLQ